MPYKIITKRMLNDTIALMEVEVPHIAKKAEAGQFIIFRVDEQGERVPLTIAEYDRKKGTVTIIFQTVGASTKMLNAFEEGDYILDFVGPLGKPTHIDPVTKRVCVVGGGVGNAIAYPQAKALHNAGIAVDMISGFRSKDIIILENEMQSVTDNLYIMTDDGTYGEKGLVTEKLKALLDAGTKYDEVVAIGPVIMMKFVAATTKPYGIKTIVSLNPIMVDGTGMCGGCRVNVGGETKFACVDGPDFEAHEVDFDELMKRNSFYKEREAHDKEHVCRLTGGKRHG
ncbi:MAG: sulfide dehydrogenase (flavoprotein) subunit SudB [Firmicutes bacterium]|nr:sulfide dehydrogenase (flavoprotein) subunit SudB [Bacillota bacterium]